MNVTCGEFLVSIISYLCGVKITQTCKPVEVQDGFLSQTFSPTHPPFPLFTHEAHLLAKLTVWVLSFFSFFFLAAFHHFMLVTSLRCQTLICVVRFQIFIIFSTRRDDPTVTCAYFSDGFVDSTTNKLWHWQFQWVTRHPQSFAWLPSLAEPGICRDTVTRNPQVGFQNPGSQERCLRDMWRSPKIKQKKQTTKQ